MKTAALIAALVIGFPALASAGGWYLMAPELPDIFVRTQKNVAGDRGTSGGSRREGRVGRQAPGTLSVPLRQRKLFPAW
jgi:hypothetical protein